LEVLFPKLQKMNNFTLRTNAVAHRVLLDASTGKARGVSFVDSTNKLEYEAYGKTVVLGASMVESIRILFNSRTREFPQGLGNSSGTLGRYLMNPVAFTDTEGCFLHVALRPTTLNDVQGASTLHISLYDYASSN